MYYSDKTRMKQTRIKLADAEFEELPVTHLQSLPDYDLFDDFLQADMMIEIARALKYVLMTFVAEKVSPLRKFASQKEIEDH